VSWRDDTVARNGACDFAWRKEFLVSGFGIEQAGANSADSLPLALAEREDFNRVRSYLRRIGFVEANLCRILKVESLSDFEKINPESFTADRREPAVLVLLIHLLFLLQDVPANDVLNLIPGEVLGSMRALDLVGSADPQSPCESGMEVRHYLRSQVWLYPVGDFLVASDRDKNRPDAVFPAISSLTFRFLRRLDNVAALKSLELCCGSGVAALALSSSCEQVISSDISPRSTHFASFNFLLNGCSNAQAVESDLYSALSGQTFDRIVAHPPYVPSLSNLVVWRDGGETGEGPIRKIVEGLGRHLRPGGSFYAACGGFDTMESAFEQRVRSWLGPGDAAFDVVLGVDFEKSPWQLATELAAGTVTGSNEDLRKLLEAFASIGARNFVMGALYIERRPEVEVSPLPPFTLRKHLSPSADGACFRRLLAMLRRLGALGGVNALQSAKPRLAANVQIRISHLVQDQALHPILFVSETTEPFCAETRLESGMVEILLQCDGKTSLVELFQAAQQARNLPEHVTVETFLKFATKMMELGYLELSESELSS
jgi:SAM-dependent methyltransferase